MIVPHLALLGAKKEPASAHWSTMIDGNHRWFLRDSLQLEALDYIIAISDHAGQFSIFVGMLNVHSATGVIYMAKTHRRDLAQRFSCGSAHAFAVELSRHYEREIRVEKIESRQEVA